MRYFYFYYEACLLARYNSQLTSEIMRMFRQNNVKKRGKTSIAYLDWDSNLRSQCSSDKYPLLRLFLMLFKAGYRLFHLKRNPNYRLLRAEILEIYLVRPEDRLARPSPSSNL
jgi:hypothetical protein